MALKETLSLSLNGAIGVTILLPDFAIPQDTNDQQGKQQNAAQSGQKGND